MNRPSTVLAATLAAASFAAGCSSSASSAPSDPCAPGTIPPGLGCEFWPTVTANAVDGAFAFGIALANPGAEDAVAHVEGGALGAGIHVTVPARSSVFRSLPWIDALKGCNTTGAMCVAAAGSSVLAAGGAYHVTTTRPLAAWQFSPGVSGIDAVGSADATALPGAHALGTYHVATAWEGGQGAPALLAVTAVEDGTTIVVTTTAAVEAGDLAAFAAGVPATVTLGRGDVLELLAYAGDLTGTRIGSDKPVQVVGGHFCANVPAGVPYCDHLEEVIPPVAALGSTYVVAASQFSSKPGVFRIVATEAGTALSYSRAVAGAPAALGAFQFADFELPTGGLVEIDANHPVLVAHYLEGQSYGGVDAWGDPSLAIAQPVSRWRTSYDLHVPVGVHGSVDVIAPAGARITRGGEFPVTLTISAAGYALGMVPTDGTTTFTADVPFTIATYGYGPDWSFSYGPAFAP